MYSLGVLWMHIMYFGHIHFNCLSLTIPKHSKTFSFQLCVLFFKINLSLVNVAHGFTGVGYLLDHWQLAMLPKNSDFLFTNIQEVPAVPELCELS